MNSREEYIAENSEDLKLMLTIRKFENTLLDLFTEGKIFGTCHTCIGQEYIPVSLRPFMKESDFIISNHRGHGHYIARYDDVKGILAEIMGKQGAICNGVGGSQHLYRERFISTGVQAEGIAVGTGIAWSMKQLKKDNVVFVYVGDGTFGRGCLYESLNFAGIWNLPMVIVVENNGIAISTHSDDSMAGSVKGRAEAFELSYLCIEDYEIDLIREKVRDEIQRVRDEKKTLIIEYKTVRVAAHSKSDDTRTIEELTHVKENDWYNQLKGCKLSSFEKLETEANDRVEAVLQQLLLEKNTEWSNYGKREN